jgi:adenosyl cobinamide kinase/adenosyl cobinamide phosphate guanylyltransferase
MEPDNRSGLPPLTLVLGGARSGKSRYAESLVMAFPPPWVYVATAQGLDEEMRHRIAEHRTRRGDEWRTIEAPLDLAGGIRDAAKEGRPILVDCLTLWLTNLFTAQMDLQAEEARLEAALHQAMPPVVLVSSEVGLGIVPEYKLGRAFRNDIGSLNQRLAALADRVILTVAGLPIVVK